MDSAGQGLCHGLYPVIRLPGRLGPGYDTNFNGGYNDAFVVKLDAARAGLRYAIFLGGQ